MKPEAGSSGSKAKTDQKTADLLIGASAIEKKPIKRASRPRSRKGIETGEKPNSEITRTQDIVIAAVSNNAQKTVSDLEFLDAVKDNVYKKLVDGELELKIDSGFKAIELKNKISETSENEKLLLEILSEIRSEELGKSKSS